MPQPFRIDSKIRLKDFDPDFDAGLDKETTRARTAKLCQRIGELQPRLYANGSHGVLLVLQGMDTSGKDGTTKRVLEFVNPAGCEVTSFKVPSSEERAHDYLWRIHRALPRYGNIGVWNRSHYEDILVVRVMGLVSKEIWKDRYDQINEFERHLAGNRYRVLKFFLHISKEEQAERLKERLEDKEKHWKFEKGDLDMRQRWTEFMDAYEDVLNRCSTSHAPWHIVPANKKWYRDYMVAKTVCNEMEDLELRWPDRPPGMEKIRIK
jgi:PPK2 family polyphosphate:nucleotide phosphotransferase